MVQTCHIVHATLILADAAGQTQGEDFSSIVGLSNVVGFDLEIRYVFVKCNLQQNTNVSLTQLRLCRSLQDIGSVHVYLESWPICTQ